MDIKSINSYSGYKDTGICSNLRFYHLFFTRVAKPVGELPHVRDPVLKIIAGCVNECA